MSKEKDLLRRLASGDNRGDFFISNELLKEIEAILDQPEQEPVAWHYIYDDGITVRERVTECMPLGEHYTVTPLYKAPPTHLISAAPELLEALENWINALDNPSEWMKCRDDAKKAIAKAHGIGGGE